MGCDKPQITSLVTKHQRVPSISLPRPAMLNPPVKRQGQRQRPVVCDPCATGWHRGVAAFHVKQLELQRTTLECTMIIHEFVGKKQGWQLLSPEYQVWHVRQSGGERAETLSVCEEFRTRQGGPVCWPCFSSTECTKTNCQLPRHGRFPLTLDERWKPREEEFCG